MTSFAHDSVKGNIQQTPLSNAFFAPGNVDRLQALIDKGVECGGGGVIGPQSNDELFIIMRAVFLQEARHSPDDVPGQVAELDARVAGIAVPQIVKTKRAHETYIKDRDRPYTLLPRGASTSSKGDRTLEYNPRI
ncbi:hypothetical protein FOA52_004348 [Chlamydomonas sp. UWO 241]|nr:hypothetical protein FOA52_004348 [Chlamydomonas sp. UWO 241]